MATKKENHAIVKRRVRRQEKAQRVSEEAPKYDIMIGRASRRWWGSGQAKT